MKNKKRFDNYIKILNDRKKMSILTTIFLVILSVMIIGYSKIESNINSFTIIIIIGSLLLSITKLIINSIKLNSIKLKESKYINA